MGGCDLDLVRDGATVAAIRAEGDAVDAACQVNLTDELAVRAWAAEVDGIRGDIQVLNANAASTRFADWMPSAGPTSGKTFPQLRGFLASVW